MSGKREGVLITEGAVKVYGLASGEAKPAGSVGVGGGTGLPIPYKFVADGAILVRYV